MVSVSKPKLEYREDAFGIGTGSPRISWIVETDQPGWAQSAYEVRIFSEERGESFFTTSSAESVLVPWPDSPLKSRERRTVSVRVQGADGHWSDWSDALPVTAGLLDAADWSATPIASAMTGVGLEQPVLFRRDFDVASKPVGARLYCSALGIYVVECNGSALDVGELAPGWTSYDHRHRYQVVDMTDLLEPGINTLGFVVADGWYRGRIGFHGGRRNVYGDEIGPLAQLEIDYDDGTRSVVITNESWKSAVGGFVSASIYDGETFDSRKAMSGWSTPGFDDSAWFGTKSLPTISHKLQAAVGPTVRGHEKIEPVSITRSPSGKLLVDFGQNISGRTRISMSGNEGDWVTIRHAEVLEHGELGTRPLRDAAATDIYILSGGGKEIYEPTFTIHGFRYAEIDGWPVDAESIAIEAIAYYSSMAEIGTFECSDPSLEKLHSNVVWSAKGNFVDIPTDCPQRDERLGWTGDIQVFAPTASFLFDCNGFLASWLEDLACEQESVGTVPFFVPTIDLGIPVTAAAAWGDAAVVVPWVMYQQFGDLEILRRQYESMTRWVDQVHSLAAPDHLWDEGMQFGDWLDPVAPPGDPAAARTDAALVATAYHAYTTRLMAEIASLIDRDDDAAVYAQRADKITEAFRREFITPSGRMACDAQTAYALALRFDLFESQDQRERAGVRLRDLVKAEDYHIGTGFVGTPLVCDALADAEFLDDAYFLLMQKGCPSWLYPVSMGATTIWERWDSMLPDGSINPGDMTSFNHYALGAVASFLHGTVAGLSSAAPGYRKLLARPRPGGGLTHATATHKTPYGEASISWTRKQHRLSVDLVVPNSVTATVDLPGSDDVVVGAGSHHFECDYRAAADDPMEPPRRLLFGQSDPDLEVESAPSG